MWNPLREHRVREHAPGDNPGVEPVLQQDARRGVGALAGAADDEDLPVAGKLAEACAELTQRDVDRVRHVLDGELGGLAHIEQEAVPAESQWLSGMSPRRTSAATIPAKLTGSFALPNGGA